MQKKLFLIALASSAIVSCSKDELVNTTSGSAIDFRAAMATRATETTINNLNSFFVSALDKNSNSFFSDLEFTKNQNIYTSSMVYYWPSDGSQLSFFAYAPSKTELGGTLTINASEKKLTDFSPKTTISEQKDFITATATGSKADEAAGVALTFAHRLSQIEVKAKNANEAYVFKVTGVRIGQPVSKGAFDFTTSAWTLNTDTKAKYDVTYTEAKTLSANAISIMGNENDNAMLLPQRLVKWDAENDKNNSKKGAYLSVQVNIKTKDGAQVYPHNAAKEYGWVAVPIDTNWEAGKKYVYTLDFSNGAGKVDPEEPNPGVDILGQAIKFTVTVDSWQDAQQPDIIM